MVSRKDRRSSERPIDEDRRLVSGRDRRQFERVLVDLEVDYRCEDTFLFAYITDISAMGIFIRTNAPEPPGTRLNLRFTPPSFASDYAIHPPSERRACPASRGCSCHRCRW